MASKTFNIGKIEFNAQYVAIWAILLGLTLVEVLIPEATAPKEFMGITMGRSVSIMMLIGLAIAKTFCVAWFYMHLVDERPMIVLLGCAPFIFSVFLTIGLFPWSF